MKEVIRCGACGARLVDTLVAVSPACRADLEKAAHHRERVGSAVRRAALALVGVVVVLVFPKLYRVWTGG